MSKHHTKSFFPLLTLLLVICSLLGMQGCKHPVGDPIDPVLPLPDGGDGDGGGSTPCDSETVYFEQQVLPILIANCARSGCHDAASAQDGVVLTSYERVMATADVRPFDLQGSDLYEVITEDDEDKRMPQPPNAPLQQAQIELIAKWISQGATNTTCDDNSTTCNTENITFSGYLKPLIDNRCIGCHSAVVNSGGINLSTHAGVAAAANSGRLLGAVSHQQGFSPMPQGGQKLSQCDIDKIAAWVQAGAQNN